MMAEMLKVLGRAMMRKYRVNQNRIRLETEGQVKKTMYNPSKKSQTKGR